MHPELAAEQSYVDHAYACLEEIRWQVERAGDAGIGEIETLVLEAWANKRLLTFEDAERGLCFGRLDLDGVLRPLYIGRRWVHEEQTPIVVNWQAPAARAFYTATVADPQGVALRRRFRNEGRRLLDLYDEPLDGSSGDIIHGVADILLEELERSRGEHMRDIVATIQADQYRLITLEPEGVLVIQGGPGTGKTAVGLHRASWLLYTYRRELERSGVLVVGPNPVFMDYISHVLPMLGEDRVEQRAVDELVAGVEPSRHDEPGVARLKGDERLADVIAAAVRALPQPPSELLAVRLEGVELRVYPDQVAALVDEATESANHAAGRDRLRMKLVRAFYERYTQRLGVAAYHSFDDIEAALRTGGYLNRTLDALWPRPKPDQLVRRLLTQPEALAAAAEGILNDDDQRLLQSSRGKGLSDADLPLLDEARALLEGPDRPHGHLIVDEAQDLTPMQLRMLRRRSAGAITILGDIAQSSGPICYTSWSDVARCLAPDMTPSVEELRLAYRVPADVMELALPLLPLIAPEVAAPIAYRSGDEPPRFVRTDAEHLVSTAVREAGHEALRDGRTALIAPAEILAQIAPLLPGSGASAFDEMGSAIQALTPRASKGLEFDRVVLVEPAAIAAGGVEGLRALYVALTRATKTLVVVHAEALPAELGTA